MVDLAVRSAATPEERPVTRFQTGTPCGVTVRSTLSLVRLVILKRGFFDGVSCSLLISIPALLYHRFRLPSSPSPREYEANNVGIVNDTIIVSTSLVVNLYCQESVAEKVNFIVVHVLVVEVMLDFS